MFQEEEFYPAPVVPPMVALVRCLLTSPPSTAEVHALVNYIVGSHRTTDSFTTSFRVAQVRRIGRMNSESLSSISMDSINEPPTPLIREPPMPAASAASRTGVSVREAVLQMLLGAYSYEYLVFLTLR